MLDARSPCLSPSCLKMAWPPVALHSEGILPMEDAERFRLLGKYRTPRFRYGGTVFCEVRGSA
jgi:hypothetical protein